MAALGIEVEDRVRRIHSAQPAVQRRTRHPVALERFFKRKQADRDDHELFRLSRLCMAQLENLVDTLRELSGAGIGDSSK